MIWHNVKSEQYMDVSCPVYLCVYAALFFIRQHNTYSIRFHSTSCLASKRTSYTNHASKSFIVQMFLVIIKHYEYCNYIYIYILGANTYIVSCTVYIIIVIGLLQNGMHTVRICNYAYSELHRCCNQTSSSSSYEILCFMRSRLKAYTRCYQGKYNSCRFHTKLLKWSGMSWLHSANSDI